MIAITLNSDGLVALEAIAKEMFVRADAEPHDIAGGVAAILKEDALSDAEHIKATVAAMQRGIQFRTVEIDGTGYRIQLSRLPTGIKSYVLAIAELPDSTLPPAHIAGLISLAFFPDDPPLQTITNGADRAVKFLYWPGHQHLHL